VVDSPSDCHSLQFEVVAESSAGTSSPGEASAGFPVAVSEFHVNVSVAYHLEQGSLIPRATISFHLPDICTSDSGVTATYTLELRNTAGALVHWTSAEYHESIEIQEAQSLAHCSSYSVSVTVFVPSYSELGSHSTTSPFTVSIGCPDDISTQTVYQSPSMLSPSLVPTISSRPNSDESGKVTLMITLGAVGVLLLLTLLLGAGLVAGSIQLRRQKTSTQTF
jgi:hypothetical protein